MVYGFIVSISEGMPLAKYFAPRDKKEYECQKREVNSFGV
jgi:hypothetical protein